MKNRKPRKYHVVVWSYADEIGGVRTYCPKWLSAWPEDPSKWGARYELTPNEGEALSFGRDAAIEIARTIRMRSMVWAMVVEA